jgi:hypothetical protein
MLQDNMYEKIDFDGLKIISAKNFDSVNYFQRLLRNRILDINEKKYRISLDTYENIKNYNYPVYDNNKFLWDIYFKAIKLCEEVFEGVTIKKPSIFPHYAYKSNSKVHYEKYHKHEHNCASIVSVYYHQIEKGDSISFLHNASGYNYYPENDELLLFPSNAYHTPNRPISRSKNRYSINIEIFAEQTTSELFSKL